MSIHDAISQMTEANRPIVIDYLQDLPRIKSGFCQYNHKIGEFARKNPENLAITFAFVIASISTEWYILKSLFPIVVQHLYDHKNKKVPPTYSETHPLGKLLGGVKWKMEGIARVWNNRGRLYSILSPIMDKYFSASDEEEQWEYIYKLYRTVYRLRGLAFAKAGFLVQLLIGRLGCVDSNNMEIFKGVLASDPKYKMMFAKGDPAAGWGGGKTKDPDHPFLDRIPSGRGSDVGVGTKRLKAYIQFFKDIKEAADSNESQRIWDIWTKIVSQKLIHSGKDQPIIVRRGDEDPGVIQSYSTGPEAETMKAYLAKYGMLDPEGLYMSKQHHPMESINKLITRLLSESIKNVIQKYPDMEDEIRDLSRYGLTGQYLRWGAKQLKDGEDFDLIVSTAKAASKLKLNMKRYPTMDDARQATTGGKNTILAPVRKKEAIYFWDDGRFVVVMPLTKEAACHHGVNTSWCISRRDKQNVFDEYKSRNARHYFFIDALSSRKEDTRKVALSFYPTGRRDQIALEVNDSRSGGDDWMFLGVMDKRQVVKGDLGEFDGGPIKRKMGASNYQQVIKRITQHLKSLPQEQPGPPPDHMMQMDAEGLMLMVRVGNSRVRQMAARHPELPEDGFRQLAADPADEVRYMLTKNPSIPADILMGLADDPSPLVSDAASRTLRRR